jgi:hypothetical protein
MSILYSTCTKIRAQKILKVFYNSYSSGYGIKTDDEAVISAYHYLSINQLTKLFKNEKRDYIKDAIRKLVKDGFLEEGFGIGKIYFHLINYIK